MKNQLCRNYLMHKSPMGLGALDTLGAQQDKSIHSSAVNSLIKAGMDPASAVKIAGFKQVSGTSPITGNTYSADTPYQLVSTMIKSDIKDSVNNALNASAEAARKKQQAKNSNLGLQLSGGNPMSKVKINSSLSDEDLQRRQYMHEYYKKHANKWKPGGPYYYYKKMSEDAKAYKPTSDAIGDHLQHGLIGDFFKKHKYFRREETSDGQKNKYRYFYSADEWNAWKNKAGNAIGNAFNRLGNALRGVSSAPSVISDGHTSLASSIGSVVERAHKYIARIRTPSGKWRYYYDEKVLARAQKMWDYWKKDGSFMSKVKKIQSAIDGEIPTTAENADAVNPGHRSSGKYRAINCQFCSLAQELRNRGYDVTAPDAPSGITNRTKILSFFGYKPQEERVELKCKATKEAVDQYGGLRGRVNGLIRGIMGSGNWHGLSSYKGLSDTGEVSVSYKAMRNDDTIKSFVPCQEDPNFIWDGNNVPDENKSTTALLNKMKEYPNGSRGSMNVFWNTGGGHSITWEKDEEGHLTIRDTQGGNKVLVDGASGNFEGIRKYFRNVNPVLPVEIARLDDKSIVDDAILDYVDSNLGSRGAGLVTKVYGYGIQAMDKLADTFKSVSGH